MDDAGLFSDPPPAPPSGGVPRAAGIRYELLTDSALGAVLCPGMDVDKTLRALNRHQARKVIDKLRGGPLTVTALSAQMPPFSRVCASQTLLLLLDGGIVSRRRQGRLHYYNLRSQALKELVSDLEDVIRDARSR